MFKHHLSATLAFEMFTDNLESCKNNEQCKRIIQQSGKIKMNQNEGKKYLRIEIKSLQCVNHQRMLRQPIVHDHMEAFQKGGSLNNGFVVGIVKSLKSKKILNEIGRLNNNNNKQKSA